MPSRYLPKIKTETVKNVANQFAKTASGKKVSKTAFKKFLKEDKELEHLTYADKRSTMTKGKAQKVLGKVIEKLKTHEKFEVSPIARKMGIRVDPSGKVSSVGIKKLYTYAAETQLKAEAPTGPTSEELAKQHRREEAVKMLHKRDRAEDVRKEQMQQAKPTAAAGPKPIQPVQLQHGVGSLQQAGPAKPAGGGGLPYVSPTTGFSHRNEIRVAFLPVSNLSGTEQVAQICRRVGEMFARLPKRFPNLIPLEREQVEASLRAMDWQSGSPWDRLKLERFQANERADIVFFGEAQRMSNALDVKLSAYLPRRNETLAICDAKETLDRIAELEQRIDWSLTDFLDNHLFAAPGKPPPPPSTDLPSSAEARELQI